VTAEGTSGQGELWLIHPNGQRARLADNIKGASGLALSPDGLWLAVAQSGSRWALNYRVKSDGSVDLPEPFYDFWVSDAADSSGARDLAMDVHGTLFAASPMGVQVFDRNGRVMAILPLPNNEPATGLCFGGPAFDTLYVTSNDRVYKRKLRTPGFQPWAQPIKLPHWGEG
jgi:sugar lactone lactonase YvrE